MPFHSPTRGLLDASQRWRVPLAFVSLLRMATTAIAYGVAEDDAAFLKNSTCTHLLVFMYLGAKHMVTGYDHLLFLFGVVFFLYRMRDVGIYVTLFAVGHSLTLLYGVLGGVHVNPYLVDAIIGLSVVYKRSEESGVGRECVSTCSSRWL